MSKPTTPGQCEDAAVQIERDFIEIVQQEIGMHEHLAAPFSQALVRGLRRRMGGRELYIPAPDLGERNDRIRREFTGPASLPAIQRWSGLSRTQIYAIVGARATPVITGRGGSGEESPDSSLETGRACV